MKLLLLLSAGLMALRLNNINAEPQFLDTSSYLYRYELSSSLGVSSEIHYQRRCNISIKPSGPYLRKLRIVGCQHHGTGLGASNDEGDGPKEEGGVIFEDNRDGSNGTFWIQTDKSEVALNFYRTILSLIRSDSAQRLTTGITVEDTVRGKCTVNVTNMGYQEGVLISRTETILHSCSNMIQTNSALSLTEDVPTWTGSHVCEHQMDVANGSFRNVLCEEQLNIATDLHAELSVRQTLTLIEVSPCAQETLARDKYERVDMEYDFDDILYPRSYKAHTMQLLEKLSKDLKSGLTMETPALFSHLRTSLASLDYESLSWLEDMVIFGDVFKSDTATVDLFMDSLAGCNSGPCIRLLRGRHHSSSSSAPLFHQRTTSHIAGESFKIFSEMAKQGHSKGLLDILLPHYHQQQSKSVFGMHLERRPTILMTSIGSVLRVTTGGATIVSTDVLGEVSRERFAPLDQHKMSGSVKFKVAGEMVTNIALGFDNTKLMGQIEHPIQYKIGFESPFCLTLQPSGLNLSLADVRFDQTPQARSTSQVKLDNKWVATPEDRTSCLQYPAQLLTGWPLCSRGSETPPLRVPFWTTLQEVIWTARLHLQGLTGQPIEDSLNFDGKTFSLLLATQGEHRRKRSTGGGWWSLVQKEFREIKQAFVGDESYTATVIGEDYITTWDGRTYTLPSYRTWRCAYQLARDKQHRFTVLQSRRMIEVITRTLAVRIGTDGRVTLDRAATSSDLPVRSRDGQVTVLRRGSYIEVTTTFGFGLRYDPTNRIATVSLSSMYHNQSTGLLGSNDGQSANDFGYRSDGTWRTADEFVQSYEVSSRSECHPNQQGSREVRRSVSSCSTDVMQSCEQLFTNRSSPLAPCFDRKDPQQYRDMCESAASVCSTAQDNICHVVAAYSLLCRDDGISLETPSSCYHCGSHAPKTSWDSHIEKKVDVVIVTSLSATSASPTRNVTNTLRALVDQLSAAFKPLYSLRLGLVAYGVEGPGKDAYSYTVNGKLFTCKPRGRVLNQHISNLKTVSSTRAGAHDALRRAAEYPFRPQAVKFIILVTDEDTQGTELDSIVAKQFEMRGITLNLASRFPVLAPQSLLGMWADGELITSSSHKTDQQRTADFPQTAHAQLAKLTEGMLIKVDALSSSNSHLVARALRRQVSNSPYKCQRCTCRAEDWGEGVSACRKVKC